MGIGLRQKLAREAGQIVDVFYGPERAWRPPVGVAGGVQSMSEREPSKAENDDEEITGGRARGADDEVASDVQDGVRRQRQHITELTGQDPLRGGNAD